MGQWNNQDTLPLQFGTAKALPDWSGEYGIGGSTREVEWLLPIVPLTMGGYTMPGIVQMTSATTPWTSATSYATAGITNPDLFIPLQTTTVQTATSSSLTVSKPQLYFEQLSVTCLDGSSTTMFAGASSLNIGLVVYSPASSAFIWAQPNTGLQLLTTIPSSVIGLGDTYTITGQNYVAINGATSISSSWPYAGKWLGQVPVCTTTSTTPVWAPTGAWVSAWLGGSAGATGATQGVVKVRLRYSWNGSINQ